MALARVCTVRVGLILQAMLALVVGVGSVLEPWHGAFAVRYAPGVFERVSRNRDMPIVSCMAAHPTLALGTWIEIEGPTGHREKARITDTSHPRDRARHIRLKRVELSYECSQRTCRKGWQGKASECPVRWRIVRGR